MKKMVRFTSIRKTAHYILHHERNFPWSKVIEIIMTTKNIRKKRDTLEIETSDNYLLCRLENHILYVINAKHKT